MKAGQRIPALPRGYLSQHNRRAFLPPRSARELWDGEKTTQISRRRLLDQSAPPAHERRKEQRAQSSAPLQQQPTSLTAVGQDFSPPSFSS